MKILAVDKICPGKRHAWYETDLGFLVRKPVSTPIHKFPSFHMPDIKIPNEKIEKIGWWKSFVNWLKNLWI